MDARNGRRIVSRLLVVLTGLVLLGATRAGAAPEPTGGCLERAADWAEVHPTLLRAIAWVESHGDPRALAYNRDGSYDIGLMQINSSWYYRGLKPWWMSLRHPCVNVAAAAWVLKHCTLSYGYTWDAVGCYHAGERWRERGRHTIAQRYIRRVQAALGLPVTPPTRPMQFPALDRFTTVAEHGRHTSVALRVTREGRSR